jgi:protein-disulfide isomerase
MQENQINQNASFTDKFFTTKNIIIGLIIVLVGFFIFNFINTQKIASAPVNVAIATDDHTTGPADAKVVVVEYADFQCPTCKAFDPIVTRISAEYSTKIKYVYRYFPLISIHKNAMLAAVSAEAAGKQGKFFEMKAKLFDGQATWGESLDAKTTFVSYAKELGLDTKKFEADMSDAYTVDRVNRDLKEANNLSLQGTPTFIINGKKIDLSDIASYELFKSYIDKTLSATQ